MKLATNRRINPILSGILCLSFSVFSMLAQALPEGFQKERIFSVAQQVVTVKFSPNDARIFVGEKNGIIRVYKNQFDVNPTQVVDISGEVFNDVDHGLLGMEVHPNFPATPVIFALYSHAPGAQGARLKRITINPTTNIATSQQLLYEGWCDQSTTHAVGDLNFHADFTNAANPIYTLYLTVGDGASPQKVDVGQTDNCGSFAKNIGALRSQSFRTTNGNPVDLSGALARLSEAEFMGNAQLNTLKVAAYGLRNPFRFTVQPNTGEIYITDVGWNNVEEINYIPAPNNDTVVENLGWPCFEGAGRQGGYEGANTPTCNSLYAANTDTKPFWQYAHNGAQAAATGAAVYTGNLYPEQYRNGLFFADYSQNWIRFLPATDNGKPNKNTSFAAAAFDNGSPIIQLEAGPLGDIYYLSYNLGNNKFELWRIKSSANPQTIATATTDATFVLPNKNVTINATSSFVASGNARYEWDLNADGVIDVTENSGIRTTSFANPGEYAVTVRVSDRTITTSAADTATVSIIVTQAIPKPVISSPSAALTWRTGDIVDLNGGLAANSAQAASFTWNVLISHCAKNNPQDCHLHDDIFRNVPVSTFVAPDHEYPSHLNAKFCATGFTGQVDNWFNPAWQSRRLISVATTDLPNQLFFNVLVSLTTADINYATAGANGKSLRFVSKTGTVYSHKINNWNTAGTSTVWLQYPMTVGGSISNTVWMYYDNANAADGQNLAITFPAAGQNTERVSVSAVQNRQQTLTTCETVELQPRLANIVMASNPTGLATTFGSTTAVWVAPIQSIIGSTSTISAPISQTKGTNQFDFLNWAHGGGGRLQEFITPDVAEVTLTANYKDMGVVFLPCVFPTMNIRGLFNGWAAMPMKMVAQCTWGATIDVVGAANAVIKFDVAGNWVTNFGDNNNDGIAEQGGGNITLVGGEGRYSVTFNDQTKAYKAIKVATNVNPVANAGVDQTKVENSTVTLTGSGTDADGTISSFKWTEGAAVLGTTAAITVPNLTPGVHTYTLTVTDNGTAVGTDNVIVTVSNVLPTASASANNTAIVEGGSVTLQGIGADILGGVTFEWKRGAVSLGAGANITIPAVDADTNTFTLIVSDGEGGQATANVVVTASNVAPSVNAGVDRNVATGTAMTLAGTGADAAGAVTFSWLKDGVAIAACTNLANGNCNILAPATVGTFTYTLNVTDNEGSIATDTMLVATTTPPNAAPVANAGADVTVEVGQVVTLNGGASTDSDGTIASYAWSNGLAGKTPTTTFAAVGVNTITLTVTDNLGATATDTVVITVIAKPTTINVNFTCNNGITVVGQNVYVVGSAVELGSWNFVNAIKLNPTAYPIWTGTITLPANTAITWKCIKILGAGVVWQPGGDNVLTTPAAGTANTAGTF